MTETVETEYVEVTATITDKWGQTETVWVGSQPAWLWDLDRCADWRKMRRAMLLADRTFEPAGWRVTFDATREG